MKDTYTRDEVIEMLIEMQKQTAKTQGFIVGHVTQGWVIEKLLGEKIVQLGGEGVEVRYV